MRMKPWGMGSLLLCAGILAGCADTAHLGVHGAATAPVAEPAIGARLSELQRQEIGMRLYELAFSPRHQAVFVVSAGGEDAVHDPSQVLRLDPKDLSVQARIPLARRGFGVALDDADNRLYVGNALDASVTVVDLGTDEVIGVVQLADPVRQDGDKPIYPHLLRTLAVDAKRHRLYAPGLSAQGSVLYVIDTRTLALERVVPGLGAGAAGIVLDEVGGMLYVSNLQGQVFALNAQTLAIEKQWEVRADQLLNLDLDRSRQRLIATDLGSPRLDEARRQKAGLVDYEKRGEGHRVVVFDTADGHTVVSIPTGQSPIAPLVDERRGRVYVTNRDAGTLTILDANDYTVIRDVALPSHPNSLTLDPDTGTVFVSIKEPSRQARESVARIPYE